MKNKRKNLINKILIMFAVLCVLLVLWMLLFRALGNVWKLPDDEFTRKIAKDIGHTFLYQRHLSGDLYDTDCYEYLIRDFSYSAIGLFSQSACEHEEFAADRTCVTVLYGDSRLQGSFFRLSNFYEEGDKVTYYDGFYRLEEISVCDEDDFMGTPTVFAESFNNIKVFELSVDMQQKAEKENIDWFEVWPELETLIVRDPYNPSDRTVYERPG